MPHLISTGANLRRLKHLTGTVGRLAVVSVLFWCPLVGAPAGQTATLKTETRAAFERYVQLTQGRNDRELSGQGPFLWVDGLPDAQRTRAHTELAAGAVKTAQLETRDAGTEISCPGGIIHHWIGTVFLPGASVDDVLGVLQDYNHHLEYYRPDVEQSRIESRDGDHFRVFLRFRRTKVITVVLNTVHDVHYFRDSPTRAHSRSSAVRIAQVDDAGQKNEREKPPGNDGGYLWAMETWWRMEQKDGGVYVQSEVVSLTRDIPIGLGWMIRPFVTSIPRESLKFTMEATRRAVPSQQKQLVHGNAGR